MEIEVMWQIWTSLSLPEFKGDRESLFNACDLRLDLGLVQRLIIFCYVSTDKFFTLSEHQFTHLQNRNSKSFFRGYLGKLNKVIF